jgi:Family of unknown function (DUF6152)
MHKHLRATLAAGVLIAGGGLAFAHDSFLAQYDINKPAILEGIVSTVDWATPRSFLTIEGAGPNGRLAEFRIDLGYARALEHKGWTRETVKEGETVTVFGWYARDDQSRIRARTLKLQGRLLKAASTVFDAHQTH